MTKTQRQLQSDETRQRIIDSATHLFAKKGFYGTSMTDLANAAGLTKGAFYHHFENKDALFYAVVQAVQHKWENAVTYDVTQAEHALDQIAVLLTNHARLLRDDPTLCLVIQGLSVEMEDNNPAFLGTLDKVYDEMISFIEGILQSGLSKQQVRDDIDPQLIALNIVGLLRGVSCFGMVGVLGLDCVAVIQAMIPLLLDGLRPKPPSS